MNWLIFLLGAWFGVCFAIFILGVIVAARDDR